MFGFFLMSGFFAAMMIERSGADIWIRSRFVRLAVPFLACTGLVGLCEFALIALHQSSTGMGPFSEQFMRLVLRRPYDWLGERWFLLILISYSIVAWVFARLVNGGVSAKLKPSIAWVSEQSEWLLFGALLVALAFYGVAAATSFHFGLIDPMPFAGFFPVYNFILYAPGFALGAIFFLNPTLRAKLLSPAWWAAPLALSSTAMFVSTVNSESTLGKLIFVANEAPCGYLWTRFILTIVGAWMSRPNRFVSIMVDAAFAIYLIHMVFVLFYGQIFLQAGTNPVLGWLLTSMLTFVSSALFYATVRHSILAGYIFNGGPFKAPNLFESARAVAPIP